LLGDASVWEVVFPAAPLFFLSLRLQRDNSGGSWAAAAYDLSEAGYFWNFLLSKTEYGHAISKNICSFYSWPGAAAAASALLTWLLLHFTRMMQILRRAAQRPMGYVASSVMLNAKLEPGSSLLHVVAMTHSLGELISAKDSMPEIYRWTDTSESHVTCEFSGGKLTKWTLFRLPSAEVTASGASPAAAP
jgi:hypothetical protein